MTRNADRDQLCFSTQQLITEYEQARDPDSTEISQQFAQLHRMMMQQKDVHSSIEGAKPINIRKNRYKDVLPYDEYRVTLETVNNSDYINASYIEDFYGKRRYIAAQGPIYETVEDFFRMIWELQVCSIVCTANDTEAGRSKFHRYWPDDQKSLNIGAYKVTLDETDDRMFVGDYFHVSPLIISQGTNRRHVLLYHFLYWHDHDVPSSEKPIFDLLNRVDQDRSSSPDTPILVHCSAGCGRTGSLIAIDLCRLILHDETLLFNEKYRQYPIYNIAAHIRQYRIALVQTVKQYLFVHKMFVFLMKSTGHVTSLATTNYEDNYSANIKSSPPSIFSNSTRRPSGPFLIKLGNPPTGRRNNNNGTITNDTYSSNNSSSDYYSLSSNASTINSTSQSSPPPIPPRTFLNNSTNKVSQNRFVHHIELPMKLKSNLRRSRPVQRREATPRNNTDEVQTARADSADPLLTTFAKVDQSLQDRRKGILIDGGANSD